MRAIPPDVDHPEAVAEIKAWCGPRLQKCSDARVEALWRQFSGVTWLCPVEAHVVSFEKWLTERWGEE